MAKLAASAALYRWVQVHKVSRSLLLELLEHVNVVILRFFCLTFLSFCLNFLFLIRVWRYLILICVYELAKISISSDGSSWYQQIRVSLLSTDNLRDVVVWLISQRHWCSCCWLYTVWLDATAYISIFRDKCLIGRVFFSCAIFAEELWIVHLPNLSRLLHDIAIIVCLILRPIVFTTLRRPLRDLSMRGSPGRCLLLGLEFEHLADAVYFAVAAIFAAHSVCYFSVCQGMERWLLLLISAV